MKDRGIPWEIFFVSKNRLFRNSFLARIRELRGCFWRDISRACFLIHYVDANKRGNIFPIWECTLCDWHHRPTIQSILWWYAWRKGLFYRQNMLHGLKVEVSVLPNVFALFFTSIILVPFLIYELCPRGRILTSNFRRSHLKRNPYRIWGTWVKSISIIGHFCVIRCTKASQIL